MTFSQKVRRRGLALLTVAALLLGGGLISGTAQAAPAPTPPDAGKVVGSQSRPKVEAVAPDSDAAKKASVQTKAPRGASGMSALAISATTWSLYNSCTYNQAYASIYNNTSATAYVRLVMYESSTGITRDRYFSIAATSYGYQYWYGVYGNYSATLYVWNGSSYAYNSYKTSTNTCSVGITATPSSTYPGWIYVTATNYGTAYATVQIRPLQPTGLSTTYLYPSPGGYSSSYWLYVGTGAKYAIMGHTLYSSLTPYGFAGTAY